MQLDGYKVIHLNDIESKKEIKAIINILTCEKRLMLPRSTMFFHPFGQMVEIEGYDLAFVKACKDKILDEQFYYEKEIAKRARISKKEIRKLCRNKTELSASQALKMGLIDAIWNPSIKITSQKGG